MHPHLGAIGEELTQLNWAGRLALRPEDAGADFCASLAREHAVYVLSESTTAFKIKSRESETELSIAGLEVERCKKHVTINDTLYENACYSGGFVDGYKFSSTW